MADNDGEGWEEHRLVRARGGPAAPSKRVPRKVIDPVPTTPAGDNAADIVGAWANWYQTVADVPLPQSLIARMGKQVKTLIVTGYTTDEIKYGLAAWSVRQLDFPQLSPTALDAEVFSYARDTRAGAEKFRADLRQALEQLSNGTFRTGNKKEDRERRTLRAIEDWRPPDER